MAKIAILVFVILVSAALVMSFASIVAACTKADFENAVGSSTLTVFIQSDGSVVPETAPIQGVGDTYTFTDNIFCPIVVDRSNIVIDGAGYTLQGPYNGSQADLWIIGEGTNQTAGNGTQVPWTVGIDMRPNTENLTVRNLNIMNFSIGIWLWTSNNTITGNAISENLVGILLSGVNNTVTGNNIANNRDGIFFGANEPGTIPTNITLSSNGFVNNFRQLSGCVCIDFNNTESPHTWDNGKVGNYWFNYNGTDANGDGIGDTPYVVDVLNKDRYPLMYNAANAPTVAAKFPVELVIVFAVLSVIAIVAILKRSRNPRQTSSV